MTCNVDLSEGCCDTDGHEHVSFDPTMSSCCEREREELRKVEEYKQKLSLVDPTCVRRRILAESVVRNPVTSARPEDRDGDATESELGSDDDDRVLEILRLQRLKELRGQGKPDSAASTGVRVLDENECCEGDLLAALRPNAKILCALIQPDFGRKDDLIECLQAVGHVCPVVAYRLQALSTLPAVLGWQEPTTAVLLMRDNIVVASVAVMETGWRDHDLIRSLEEILSRACDEIDKDAEDHDDDDGDGPAPCDICGRRYLHTHVNNA